MRGQTYLSADIGWSAANLLRADLFRHTLDLDMAYHKGRMPGEMIERIDGDVRLGIYRDYPVSKGCASPFAPIWIKEMVSRQG